ncbi:MAG: response regulator [Phototrophicaceae bacterium]
MLTKENRLKGLIILACDDEPMGLDIIKLLLTAYGGQVFTATDGKEGLEFVQSHTVDLILTDLSMPNMSGWEMKKHLEQNTHTAQIPVIALTAHAMAGDGERVLGAGFSGYITKPIMPQTFMVDFIKILKAIPSLSNRFA